MKLIRYGIGIYLVLTAYTVSCQYQNIEIYEDAPLYLNQSLYYDTSKAIIITIAEGSLDFTHNIFRFQVMDTLGMVDFEKDIDLDSINGVALKKTNTIVKMDSFYYFFSDLFTADNKQFIIKMNEQGERKAFYVIEESPLFVTNLSVGLTVFKDKLLLGNTKQWKSTNLVDMAVSLRTKTNEVIWDKTFGKSTHGETLYDIVPLPNNEFMLLGIRGAPNNTGQIENNKTKYYLVRIDSTGQVLQEIEGSGTRDGALSTGGYYTNAQGEGRLAFGCSHLYFNPNTGGFFEVNRLFVMDMDGKVIYEKEFGFNESGSNKIVKIKKVQDGFIVVGNMVGDGKTSKSTLVYVKKINEQAEEIWSSTFNIAWQDSTESWFNEITGLDIMPSGSILVSGHGSEYFGQYCSFLLKLDSEGCLEPNCRAVATVDASPKRFAVYPNPAKEAITLVAGQSGTYRIFDALGQMKDENEMKEGKTEIDISTKESGIYFVKIESQSGITVLKFLKI